MDEVHPMGSYSKKQLSIITVESFPTKIVKSGYYYGVDTWSSLSITISFLTCTFQLLLLVIEKNGLQLNKIIVVKNVIFNYNCELET